MVPTELWRLSRSIQFCSLAFGVVKDMYPNITSILTVTGTEYELIDSGDMQLHSIEATRNDSA